MQTVVLEWLRQTRGGVRVLAAYLLLCTSAYASDLSGTWILDSTWNDADSNVVCGLTFVFERERGDELKGTVNACLSVAWPITGKIKNDAISVTGYPFYASRLITLTGTHQGDHMRFTQLTTEPAVTQAIDLHVSRATAARIAVLRQNMPKTLQLKKLPLPPLKDLSGNRLVRTPPMGWNSFYSFANRIDDKTVREVADAIVATGLRDAGYVYVNLDDGWQGHRDAKGVLHANTRFPDMGALAKYLHAKGLKFGIYSSPGPSTCGGYAGSHGYEVQDAQTFAKWGVDYLKYDVCSVNGLYTTDTEMRAVYQEMGAALQATGRPIVYSLSVHGRYGVGSWGRQAGGHLWRTNYDIDDTWVSMSVNGFERNGKTEEAGPGGWNDPDMLQIGRGGMTMEEYRTHMTLWAISAAPLILSNDPRILTQEVKDILLNKEVIAVDQDVLGIQGERAIQQDDIEIWTKPLSDGTQAIALFNRGTVEKAIRVRWADLGLKGAQAFRDLWQGTDLGRRTEPFEVIVPGHGAVLLRSTPVS